MGRTAKQVLQSQRKWLAGSEGSCPMHGKCMGYGSRLQHPSSQLPAPSGSRPSTLHLAFGTALCDMICGRPGASGVPFLVRLSYLQMRSELHQMAAGRRVGKCTVHAGPSHRWQTSLQPMETLSRVREAERVVRASNRMRRSRSAVDRRARFEVT